MPKGKARNISPFKHIPEQVEYVKGSSRLTMTRKRVMAPMFLRRTPFEVSKLIVAHLAEFVNPRRAHLYSAGIAKFFEKALTKGKKYSIIITKEHR